MFLNELTELNGGAGDEKRVRDFIIEKIKDKVDEYWVDNSGNLIAHKKGKMPFKVGIIAHMDEVSFMITSINEDGTLSFRPVGGVDPRVVVGKKLKIGEKLGVVGYKPIHLQREKKEKISYEELKIFIGASKKEEVEIKVGDYAYFTTTYEKHKDFVIAKALDDRVGCSINIRLIYGCESIYDTYYIFTAGEEIGGLGSAIIMEQVDLDTAIVLEGTTAGDLPELEKSKWATHIGDGPVITFFHSGYVIDERVYRTLIDAAEKNKIPYQLKRRTAGSTDARVIAKTGKGAPSGVVSVPCRYIHSPVSIMNLNDFENTFKLIKYVLESEELKINLREE